MRRMRPIRRVDGAPVAVPSRARQPLVGVPPLVGEPAEGSLDRRHEAQDVCDGQRAEHSGHRRVPPYLYQFFPILAEFREIDRLGGVLSALEHRYQRSQIQAAAHRYFSVDAADLTLTFDNDVQTLPMLLTNIQAGYVTDYGMLMLAVLIASLPAMLVFLALQKSFAQGITGAIK